MYIVQLLNNIKQNSRAKKKYFYFRNIKNLKFFINKLIELNIIFVQNVNNKYLKIYINYNKNTNILYNNIKILYNKSRPIHVSVKTLKKIKKFKYNSYYILTTTKGFKTNFEALTTNCGGILICKFNY